MKPLYLAALAASLCVLTGCAVAVTRDKDGVQRVTAGFSVRTDEIATADKVTDTVLRGFESADGLLAALGIGGVGTVATLLMRRLGYKEAERVVSDKYRYADQTYYDGRTENMLAQAQPTGASTNG